MPYDNRGKVSLWKRDPNAPPKAPALKGVAVAHRNIREGDEVEIALWRNESDNPKAPMMTGKLSDPYKPKQQAPAQYNTPTPEPFDDEIPF